MKKTILIIAVSALIAGCKKKTATPETPPVVQEVTDTTPPVITLNGKAKDTIALQSAYTDPGATAIDDKDGSLTAFIVASGMVNTSTAGNYVKEYIVKDAAGNSSAKAIRNIHVRNEAYPWAGNYLAACHSETVYVIGTESVTGTSDVTYTTTVELSPNINQKIIVNRVNFAYVSFFKGYEINAMTTSVDNTPYGSINGLPGAVAAKENYTLSASKTSFTITTSVLTNGYDYRSKNVYTKQ